MSERIGVIVFHHLGIARRAGTEEDQKRIGGLQVFRSCKNSGEIAVHRIVIHPAVTFTVDNQFPFEGGRLIRNRIHRIANTVPCGTDNALDVRFVDAVLNIVSEQLDRGRDDYRTEFVQCVQKIPELVMTPDNQHDPVSLADAQRIKQVGCARRVF